MNALDDHTLASATAREAGELLRALRLASIDPEELRAAGDTRANELILDRLGRARPDDPVLSEESAARPPREAPRLWIVDPLDGTREFGEPGRRDWAVHVALVERGVPVAGAVALPARELVLGTRPAPIVPPREDRPVRLLVSRTRPPAWTARLREDLDAELVSMGSAGAKAMAVVLGEGDVYAHAGGQYAWDSAAPVAVAIAAGLHATRLDGSPLRYPGDDPWIPDLLVCRPELAASVWRSLAAAGPSR